MIIDDISFHDAQILKTTQVEQTLDLLLDFPTDWEKNIFEEKVLRFYDVIFHSVDEIPFSGPPAILVINNLGQIMKKFGAGRNLLEPTRARVEIQTNPGTRIIE